MSRDTLLPEREQLLELIRIQSRIASLGPDFQAVMPMAASEAMQLTQASGAVVELCEQEDMVYHAVAGSAAGQLGLRIKRDHSLSGLCVTQGRSLYCADSHTDPRVDLQACERVGLRSMLVMPLLHEERCVGVLKVFSSEPDHFTQAQQSLLSLLSTQLAASMYHAARLGSSELLRQATTDPLTGLANRALFLDRLRQSLACASARPCQLAVMMLDMDGLKPINDQCGHRTGDAALCEVGRRIHDCVRAGDLVARLGGDEFAVLLPCMPTSENVQELARRISERCSQSFEFEGHSLQLGASIGVAFFPQDGQQPEQLLERADLSMYRQKRQRKQQPAPASRMP